MELHPDQLAEVITQLDAAKDEVRDLVASACAGGATNQALFQQGIRLAKRLMVCRALLGVPPDADRGGVEPC